MQSMTNRMRKLLSVVLALVMIASVGLVPAAWATDDPAQEEYLMWTTKADTLFDGMVYDIADVCQFVLSPLDRSIPYAKFAALDAEIAAKDLTRMDVVSLLSSAMTKAGRNLYTMNGVDILKLDAKTLNDVASFMFDNLRSSGVVVDSTYELESGRTVVYWLLRVYYTGSLVTLTSVPADVAVIDNNAQTIRTMLRNVSPQTVHLTLAVKDPASAAAPISFDAKIINGNTAGSESLAWVRTTETLTSGMTYKLADVYEFALFPYDSALPFGRLSALDGLITAKGLDSSDMKALLNAAMTSAGIEKTLSVQQILQLGEKDRLALAQYVILGLKTLGVDVRPAHEAESPQTILYWLIRTYDPERLVTVSCSPESAAIINTKDQTIFLQPITSANRAMTLTLSAKDKAAAPECQDISFNVQILGAFDPQVRSLAWSGLKKTVLVTGSTYDLKDIYSFVLSPFDNSIADKELSDLDAMIAQKKLSKATMVNILAYAMTQIGKDLSTMNGSDVLTLSKEEQSRAVTYIFQILKTYGLDIGSKYTLKDPMSVLYWLLRTYDTGRLVTLSSEAVDTVDIDNEAQTIRVLPLPIVQENTIVRLTLSANDPDPSCRPITMDVRIEKPLKFEKPEDGKLTLNYKDTYTMKMSKPVQWYSSDEEVVTVTKDGLVTAAHRGKAQITAVADSTGEVQTCSVTVRYTFWQWLIVIFLFGWAWY